MNYNNSKILTKDKIRVIDGASSFFLDGIRVCAALIVLIVHARDRWFTSQIHSATQSGNVSHAAVVVFFVLSGYVIAHTTANNNRGPLQYAKARLSRLYSVVLPSLLITAFIEFIVRFLDPTLRGAYSREITWPRYIISGGFMNEIWFLTAAPPINGPLWSLSFEFWYYVIFGLWFYSDKSLVSRILPLIACFFAGPKILLMMPIWLFGCISYHVARPAVNFRKAWVFVIISLGAAFFAIFFLPVFPFGVGIPPLAFAGGFVTDWVIGLFIGIALWVLPTEKSFIGQSRPVAKFRKIADLTFPIYVLHFPIIILCKSIFPHEWNNLLKVVLATTITLFMAGSIGLFLEKKRRAWANIFGWMIHCLNKNGSKII